MKEIDDVLMEGMSSSLTDSFLYSQGYESSRILQLGASVGTG
jgi:hypothetical protein